jgi:hypothetical protein
MSVVLAAKAAQTGLAVGQAVQKVQKEVLGYDFVGLLVKLLFFQAVALLIAKYIELVNGVNNALKTLLGVLGINVPNFLPQVVIDFYTTGIKGVKYWDVIKIITVLLIVLELNNYIKAQKALGGEPSPMTEGVFFLLIGFFLIITVPEMVQRIKEANAVPPLEGGGGF